MLHMHISTPTPITFEDAGALLPYGSTVHATSTDGWCTVALNVPSRIANAFADFVYPHYIPGWRNGPTFTLRRENLRAFVERWDAFA